MAAVDVTRATSSLGDAARAEQLLLTPADLPPGWGEASRNAQASPLDRCRPPQPSGETGRADSGAFSRGGTASFNESIALFATPQAAAASLDLFPDEGRCVVALFNGGSLDSAQTRFSDATVAPQPLAGFGDRSAAYRITIRATAGTGQATPATSATVFLDVELVAQGRAVLALQAGDEVAPFKAVDLQDLVTAALTKLRANQP